jgi:thiol-disulfide isomerase/thioredoxin
MKITQLVVLAVAATSLTACGRPADTHKASAPAKFAATNTAYETGDQRAEDAGRNLIGERAPPLKLRTIDGKTIDLAKSLGGKPVYLKFWATWCVPCREQMPHFEHAYETLGNDVEVVAINTNFNETPGGVKAYRAAHGLKMPIVMDDGRLGSALNLRVTPTHVLIDRTGHIVYVGHSADAKLDAALQRLRTSTPETVPALDKTAAPVTATPPTSAQTSTGETFPFADPQDRRETALVFFAPWCEDYLKDAQPAASRQCKSIREQADQLAAAGDVRLIGIASGLWTNARDVRDYEAKNRVRIPITLDASGDIFRSFHVRRFPTLVILGPDGREKTRYTGEAAVAASKSLSAKANASPKVTS